MKLRNMIMTSLLIAVGFVLHHITPPIMGGMRPDFLLAMMFVALYLDDSPKNAFLAGALSGIFAALTTTFPGGQVGNIADKMVAAFAMILIIRAFSRFNPHFSVPAAAFIGTVISGVTFLSVALLVAGGLPMAFSALFITVVIPAAVVNVITTYVCYNVVFATRKAIKRA